MAKKPYCTKCGSLYHYQSFCPLNRKPIKKQSDKTKAGEAAFNKKWFTANPPDQYGFWYCYLRISPMCLVKLDRQTVTKEHVKPKSRKLELKFDLNNVLPACSFCNVLKGSRSLERLAIDYPHLNSVLDELNNSNAKLTKFNKDNQGADL